MGRHTSPWRIKGFVSLSCLILFVCVTISHAQEVRFLDGQCAISVPEGWRVDTSYGDAGMVTYPPDGLAWPVELAIWEIPKGAAETPSAAALAHEAAIRRDYLYTRRNEEAFATVSGLQGLLITGELQQPDQPALEVAFVAYAASDRYFVVGTFCLPGQLEATLSRYLNPIAKNISIGAAPDLPAIPPSVAPGSAAPIDPKYDGHVADAATSAQTHTPKPGVTTPEVVAIIPPSIAPGSAAPIDPKYDGHVAEAATSAQASTPKPGVTTPEVVAIIPPSIAPGSAVENDLPAAAGFARIEAGALSIEAPDGFVIEELGGKWLVHPAGMDRLVMGVAVWPLVTDGTETAEQLARNILTQWDVSAKAPVKYRSTGDEVFFGGRGNTAAGKYRVIGSCKVEGDSALLRAAYVMDSRATEEWPTLVTMLASAKMSAITVDRKPSDPVIDMWQMPEYPALSLPIPAGWRARGQVNEYDGLWALTVEALDPGPSRRYVVWRQPITPMFRQVTTLLQGLGYKELDRYTTESGSATMLFSRVGPLEFVEGYYNQHTRTPLTNALTVETRVSEQVRRLVNSADSDGAYIVCKGDSVLGQRQNTYIVACGNAVQTGLHNWQVAILEASEPAADSGMAIAALRAMVEGAQLDEKQGDVPSGLREVLRRAKESVSVLPVITLPEVPATGSAIELAATDGTETWNTPTDAGVIWKKAVSVFRTGTNPAEILPELDTLRY